MRIQLFSWLIIMAICFACTQSTTEDDSTQAPEAVQSEVPEYEALSLLGDTLQAVELPEKQRALYDSALRVAQNNFQENPDDLENIVRYGQILAYAGHFQEAIDVYSEGISNHPDSPALYRHRGHRYITLRQFDKAEEDLMKAAQLIENQPIQPEPNGLSMPNSSHQISSLQFNIWYHLGLAHFLQGEYGNAAGAYEKSLEYADTDDETVAAADWLYMSYRRMGEDEVAEKTLGMIALDMKVTENQSYYDRLLMHKGILPPDSVLKIEGREINTSQDLSLAAEGYGVANYYMYMGEDEKARELLEIIVEGAHWPAFGHIAAEADLLRMNDSINF